MFHGTGSHVYCISLLMQIIQKKSFYKSFLLQSVCKLGDFGCCEVVEDMPVSPTRSYLTGTFAYRAPELLRGQSASCKADIYSIAICLWQFWTRDIPYRGKNQHVVIFGVVSKGLRPKLSPDNMPDNKYHELMTSCWNAQPDKRPSSKELLDVLACWSEAT